MFSTFLINILVSDEEDETQVSKEEENKEGEDPEKSEENDKLEEEKGPEEGVDSGGGDEEPEDNSAPSNTFGQCQNSLLLVLTFQLTDKFFFGFYFHLTAKAYKQLMLPSLN